MPSLPQKITTCVCLPFYINMCKRASFNGRRSSKKKKKKKKKKKMKMGDIEAQVQEATKPKLDLAISNGSSAKPQAEPKLDLAISNGSSAKPQAELRQPSPPKGTWLHAGYHLTTGTAGGTTPNVPGAIASLGWGPGFFFLMFFTVASFYSYYLLIVVLHHLDKKGKRSHRYGEVCRQIIGKKWASFMVASLQFVVCFASVISFVILGGQSLKAVFYGYSQPHAKMTLPLYISIFGFISTILSQMPTFHSLRHLNLVSLVASVFYGILVVCGSILAYYNKHKPRPDYTLLGTTQEKVMSAFNALSILSTIYGNPLLTETQATISNPIKQNMTKGLCLCYSATIAIYFPVAFASYWAFGNASNSNIVLSMISENGTSYIPDWMFIVTNMCMLIQLSATTVFNSQPAFDIIERRISQRENDKEVLGKSVLRVLLRTIFMMLATLLAAMLPFFGDFNAIVGSIGYTPIVFILPMTFYIIAYGLPRHSPCFIAILLLMILFVIITLMGGLTSIQQLLHDERTFNLFANL